MEYIYTVVDSEGAFPDAFTSYSDALAEVKDKYKYCWKYNTCWGKGGAREYGSSQQDDDDIEEGSKLYEDDDENPNVTQISIEVRLVTIYRLKIKR